MATTPTVLSILSTPEGREATRTALRAHVSKSLRAVPQIQPAFIRAIEDRVEKALNRMLHEAGVPQVGEQRYKPAGKKAG